MQFMETNKNIYKFLSQAKPAIVMLMSLTELSLIFIN